jgi:hypothetical protein
MASQTVKPYLIPSDCGEGMALAIAKSVAYGRAFLEWFLNGQIFCPFYAFLWRRSQTKG